MTNEITLNRILLARRLTFQVCGRFSNKNQITRVNNNSQQNSGYFIIYGVALQLFLFKDGCVTLRIGVVIKKVIWLWKLSECYKINICNLKKKI